MQKEALREKYNLSIDRQLKIKSKFLDRLEKEIDELDFSKTPADKTLSIALKIMDSLQERPNFKSIGLSRAHEDYKWIG